MTTNTYARCNGINHSDTGKIMNCKRCGCRVVRREDGKIFPLRTYTTEGGYERITFSCYMRAHTCDPQEVKLHQEAKDRDIAAGRMVPGQAVIVARGRKFPKGTTGKITWVGEGQFGERARVQPEDGEAFFIATKNLDVQ